MADFRRATNEFKTSLEREVQIESLKETTRALEVTTRPDSLARGAINDLINSAAVPALPAAPAPKAPETPSEPENTKPASGTTANDGGSGTIH